MSSIPPGMWTDPSDFSEEFRTSDEEEFAQERAHESTVATAVTKRSSTAITSTMSTASIDIGGTVAAGRSTSRATCRVWQT